MLRGIFTPSTVGKTNTILINTRIDDLPIEVQDLLNENMDIIVDDFPNEFPQLSSISHPIDLIPGTIFPNKATYRMTPRENKEIRNQV